MKIWFQNRRYKSKCKSDSNKFSKKKTEIEISDFLHKFKHLQRPVIILIKDGCLTQQYYQIITMLLNLFAAAAADIS